ncbi:MAG: hypothetical protein ACI92B_002542, partial [Marinobacter maritimus]
KNLSRFFTTAKRKQRAARIDLRLSRDLLQPVSNGLRIVKAVTD